MQVYSGHLRRQVGGGVWSTIRRGIKPLISRLKPLATKAAKKLAKKALGSAMTVGSKVAMGENIKSALKDEGKNLKSEAMEKLRGFKRKYLPEEGEQQGSGNKRRKVSRPKIIRRKMPNRKVARKRRAPSKGKRKVYKRKSLKGRKKRSTSCGRVSKKRSVKRRQGRKSVHKDIFGQ